MAGGNTWAPEKAYRTWGDCLDAVSEPHPDGRTNLLGGTLFVLAASPFFLLDLEFFLVVLYFDGMLKLIHPGHDMRLTKGWFCWWAALFGRRRFTVSGTRSHLREGGRSLPAEEPFDPRIPRRWEGE
jgi:hypothetical protein